MAKYLQRQIAENWATPYVALLLTMLMWLLAGGLVHGWWLQLVILAAIAFVLGEISNGNVLIRLRNRMTQSVFMLLATMVNPLFGELLPLVATLCFVTGLLLLFRTYQTAGAVGTYYFSFLLFGVAVLLAPVLLFFVPLLWLLSASHLQSLNSQEGVASLLGLLTPFWMMVPMAIYVHFLNPQLSLLSPLDSFVHFFSNLVQHTSYVTTYYLLPLFFIVTLTAVSIVYFWNHRTNDRIQTRLLLTFFFWSLAYAVLLLLVLPGCYDSLMFLVIALATPLVAHLLTVTNTKLSNIFFFVVFALTIFVSIVSLIGLTLSDVSLFFSELWNG